MNRRKLKQNTLEQYYRRQANELGMTAFFSTLFISTAREREALYAMMRPPPLLTTTLSKLCSALHKMCCLDSAVPVAGMNKREKKKEKTFSRAACAH